MATRKGRQIHEGKAKILYEHPSDPSLAILFFKDDATAFDGEKHGRIGNKGIINNSVSSKFFQHLHSQGIQSHFVEKVSEREMLVKRIEIVPVEMVVRNVAAGRMSPRTVWEEGTALKGPVVEMYYKNDELHDPLLNEEHVLLLELATEEEIVFLKAQTISSSVANSSKRT